MTTGQLLAFIRDNISMISCCRLPETSYHYVTWCEAQVSLAWAMASISADDRKQLTQEIEDAKLTFLNKMNGKKSKKVVEV